MRNIIRHNCQRLWFDNDRTDRSRFRYLHWKRNYAINCFNRKTNFRGDSFTLLIDALTLWISAYGYAGVFIAMLIETVFPPIPS